MRYLGVREADIADVVQDAFALVAVEWAAFVAPEEVPAQTARRRWIANVLLHFATEHQAAFRTTPGAQPSGRAVESLPVDSHERLITVRDLIRRLEHTTTARRWRMWIAHEVDGTSIAEIARQEGCRPARVQRSLELARRDFNIAAARAASDLPRGRWAPAPSDDDDDAPG